MIANFGFVGYRGEIAARRKFTSSMEREIRNFQQQINAIDEVLQKGGYAFIEGRLVRIIPAR